jgi:hypothetical protein
MLTDDDTAVDETIDNITLSGITHTEKFSHVLHSQRTCLEKQYDDLELGYGEINIGHSCEDSRKQNAKLRIDAIDDVLSSQCLRFLWHVIQDKLV